MKIDKLIKTVCNPKNMPDIHPYAVRMERLFLVITFMFLIATLLMGVFYIGGLIDISLLYILLSALAIGILLYLWAKFIFNKKHNKQFRTVKNDKNEE